MGAYRIKEQIAQQNYQTSFVFFLILFYFYAFPEQHQILGKGNTLYLITGIITEILITKPRSTRTSIKQEFEPRITTVCL